MAGNLHGIATSKLIQNVEKIRVEEVSNRILHKNPNDSNILVAVYIHSEIFMAQILKPDMSNYNFLISFTAVLESPLNVYEFNKELIGDYIIML